MKFTLQTSPSPPPLTTGGRWDTIDDFTTSFLHFSLFCPALWDLVSSRPVHSLMLFSQQFLCLPCLLPPFIMPCKIVLPRPAEWETCPCHCSLRQGVFVWSSCLLDLGVDFLVDNMVFLWDVYYLAVAPHFHSLYSSLELCCEGPWFTSIQEDGCDKGARQSYLGAGLKVFMWSNCLLDIGTDFSSLVTWSL